MTNTSSTEIAGKPNPEAAGTLNPHGNNNKPQACHISNNHVQREPIRNNVCYGPKAKYREDGRTYCILHSPDPEKNEDDFNNAVRERIEKNLLDFRGVIFRFPFHLEANTPYRDANFSHAVFQAPAKFIDISFGENCIFDDAVFYHEARFSGSRFKKSSFSRATFHGPVRFNEGARFRYKAAFDHAKFQSDADFDCSIFASVANFDGSEFTGTYLSFRGTIFGHNVTFRKSVFNCYVNFIGTESYKMFKEGDGSLSLDHSKIENPQNIHFQNVRLQAGWFSNVDCKSFDFIDCRFQDLPISMEVNYLEQNRKILHAHPHLERIYWRFAENCEEIKQFENASSFRKKALDVRCFELKAGRRFDIWLLNRWYWFSSHYAEDPTYALLVLLGLLSFSIYFFSTMDFKVCPQDILSRIRDAPCEIRHLYFFESIAQGFASATFQNIDSQKFLSPVAEVLRSLEKILVPIQTALLVLAVRRKFMR